MAIGYRSHATGSEGTRSNWRTNRNHHRNNPDADKYYAVPSHQHSKRPHTNQIRTADAVYHPKWSAGCFLYNPYRLAAGNEGFFQRTYSLDAD